jgi:hypothetical protein
LALTPASTGVTIHLNFKLNSRNNTLLKLSPPYPGTVFEINSNTSNVGVIEYNPISASVAYVGNIAYTTSTNIYIAITISGSTVKTYVNNSLAFTGTSRVAFVNNNYDLYGLGSWNGGGYANMNVYDFRIMNTTLSDSAFTPIDFYADRLGNLLTAPVTGQSLANWLGGATGYVRTWYDQSGKGNDAEQTTAALQPKIDLVNKQIDFKPSAYFNLPNGTVPFGNTNYTMIAKHNTINSTYAGIIGSGTYGTQHAVNALEWNSTAYYNYWWANDISGGTLTSGNILSAKYDNTIGRTLYVNGSSVATNTNKNRNSTNIQNTIGTDLRGDQGQGGGNRPMNGELYYVFLFGSALSDADRTLVEALPI